MKATLVYEDKRRSADGTIVEMRIWRLPAADTERPHGFKYSLFYGRAGVHIVGYDNERGKGDHRHYGERERPYRFESIHQLIADFLADIEKSRAEGL